MKMKKLLALVLAGTMMASLSMVASASTLSEEELEKLSESFSSVSENSVAKSENEARADREAKAEALAAEAIGIPLSTIYAARAEDKEIGEYISNSVYKVAGIDVVTPVAQGGDVIVDGEKTNITFTIDKPYYAYVKPALAQAAAVGGTAINVVDVKAPVRFSNAVVNFYTPGVTADQNIQIFQYVNGTWASVTVNEVREDHVVANLTAPGVLVFVNVQ
ncbi:hypothetical protein [Parablautia intestinalis]|jgi:hypothetical protein|uniref:hypothetical protein n=1 Tax=Parablautia intestinalis TaxID=2320100 RepID=UPI00256F1109|nr:hypothetical protein [Parablautia intestinalis]MCI8613631.1 hypothetical protein [Lachnospiraceae bacterium]